MSKLSFKSVLLYQNQNTHFTICIQGDIYKYTLYRYCYSKFFTKGILQIISSAMM